MEDSQQNILDSLPDHMESERLIIRVPRPGDGAIINEAIVESFAELINWLPWAQEVPSVSESETFASQARESYEARTAIPLILFQKEGGRFVGASGFPRINWDVPRVEIGYWCRSSLTGKGYISEAVARVTRFAFESAGANRVEIRVDSRNERSYAIPERLGYTLEGTLRNDSRDLSGQALRDTRLYSMISTQELHDPGGVPKL